jgi:hypothetical protein
MVSMLSLLPKSRLYVLMNDSFHLKEGERILNDVTSRVIGPDVTALLACMCIFFLESRRQHLLWALESVWHFRDTRVYAFHYAELGIYQFKNNQVLRESILKVHILVNSEHKLCQTWNTCIVSFIYWSIAFWRQTIVRSVDYYYESTVHSFVLEYMNFNLLLF